MTVLLPWPAAELSDVPASLQVEVWDGHGDPPESVESVRLYVQPYTFRPAVTAVIGACPTCRSCRRRPPGSTTSRPMSPVP